MTLTIVIISLFCMICVGYATGHVGKIIWKILYKKINNYNNCKGGGRGRSDKTIITYNPESVGSGGGSIGVGVAVATGGGGGVGSGVIPEGGGRGGGKMLFSEFVENEDEILTLTTKRKYIKILRNSTHMIIQFGKQFGLNDEVIAEATKAWNNTGDIIWKAEPKSVKGFGGGPNDL